MDLLKLHFFIVIILIICLSQENFVNSIGEEENKRDELDRNFYATQAFLHLRSSSDPADDSFTTSEISFSSPMEVDNAMEVETVPPSPMELDTNEETDESLSSSSVRSEVNYFVASEAKAYYVYIFKFIKIDDEKMNTPQKFCMKLIPKDDCLRELKEKSIPFSEDKYRVLKYIYENLVYKELHRYKYVQDFMMEVLNSFQPFNNDMKLPNSFCAER